MAGIVGAADEMRGRPQLVLSEIAGLPDEVVRRMRPLLGDGERYRTLGDGLWGWDESSEQWVELCRLEASELYILSLFNGQYDLETIGGHLAAQFGMDGRERLTGAPGSFSFLWPATPFAVPPDRPTVYRDSFAMTPLFMVPVLSDVLLFSPWQSLTALVNKRAARDLLRLLPPNGSGPAPPEALRGLVSGLSESPAAGPRPQKGPLRPAFLGIIPTRGCNMACRYCGFGAGRAPKRAMDPAMASAAVDWMACLARKSDLPALEIHFFGGEPLTALEVVETAVHRARFAAARDNLIPHLEVSTNGLMNEETAMFVGDYFQAVVVSIDGLEKDHDRQRPLDAGRGSFKNVRRTLEILSRSPADLFPRCCITRENVGRMESITRWFCDSFAPAAVNFETLSETPQSRAAGLHPPDPHLFAQNCLASRRLAARYEVPVIYASAETDEARNTFCPVGRDALILSPDGRVSACYLMEEEWAARGLDMNMGRFSTSGGMDIDRPAMERLRRQVLHKPGCEGCFCRWTCAGGCLVRNNASGIDLKNSAFCRQTRLLTACFLLDDLGLAAKADALLNDRAGMDVLTLNPDDRVAVEGWK